MIPCTSIPDGVWSMDSVADTSVTPADRSAWWIATSSARLRASRSSLCTMQNVTRDAVMNASISCNPSRSADLADSPASTNSRTTRAPSSAAFRVFASRCAGIEKPSSVPPRSTCSRVETRRYDTASSMGVAEAASVSTVASVVIAVLMVGLLAGAVLGLDSLAHP